MSTTPQVSAELAKQREYDELVKRRTGIVETPVEQPVETPVEPTTGQAVKSNAGFVVTIVGYSPYKDIYGLLDPTGVGQDKSRWGFITRLKNIDKFSDVNSFALFDANSIQNFTYNIEDVYSIKGVPAGIGVFNTRVIEVKANPATEARILGFPALTAGSRNITENILIDPMTREVIDKVKKYNEDGSMATDKTGRVAYEINDHWFEIKAKFLWKGVPAELASLAGKM